MPSTDSHDLTMASGGTTKGLMRWRGNGNLPVHFIRDAQTIAPRQLTTAELDHAQLPPDLERIWDQSSWIDGMGGIDHYDHPYTIADATKIDASEEGVLKLARDIYSTSVNTEPDVYVPSGAAIVGTEVHHFIGQDIYYWDYTNDDWDIATEPVNPGTGGLVYRNGVEFNGYTFVPCWADDVGSAGSYTADDQPAAYMYKDDAAAIGTWTHTKPLEWVAPQPNRFKYFAVANNLLWGAYIADRADSTANLAEAVDSSETSIDVSDGSQFSAGDVICVDGHTEDMLVSNVVSNTLTVVRAYRGTAAGSADDTDSVYKITENVHHIRSNDNPINGGSAWSAATTIGDSSSPITGLVGVGTNIYVVKTDGLYKYDGTTVTEIDTALRAWRHPDFGRGSFKFKDNIMIPKGTGGMLRYDVTDDVMHDVSLEDIMPDRTELHGRVCAGWSEPDRFFILVHESANTKYHVLMAIETSRTTPDFAWHHIGEVSYTTSTDPDHVNLMVESVPSGSETHHRLWIGVESTGSNLYPYYYPMTDDVDDNYTNDGDANVVTAVWNAKFSDVDKLLDDITCTTANCGAAESTNAYIEVQYRVDGGSWTWITGTQTTSQLTSSPQTLTFASGVNGKLIELRFLFRDAASDTTTTLNGAINDSTTSVVYTGSDVFSVGDIIRIDSEYMDVTAVNAGTNTLTVTRGHVNSDAASHADTEAIYRTAVGTTTPELQEFVLRSQVRMGALKLLPLAIHVGDEVPNRAGALEKDSTGLMTQLRSWNAQTDEVTVVDELGTSRECIFLPGTFKEQVVSHEYLRRPVYRVDFILAEV